MSAETGNSFPRSPACTAGVRGLTDPIGHRCAKDRRDSSRTAFACVSRPVARFGAPSGKSGETGMDRAEKAEAVSALNATLSNAATVVIVRNLGLTVAQSTVLRQQIDRKRTSLKSRHQC